MTAGLSRSCGAVLLAVALLLRVAFPAGWMPIAVEGGFVIAPCSGAGPIAAMPVHDMSAIAGMAHDMPAHHGDGQPVEKPHEQACPFATLALAAPPAEPAVLPLPGIAYLAPVEARHVAFSRAGIGAPPRPATGPPLSA